MGANFCFASDAYFIYFTELIFCKRREVVLILIKSCIRVPDILRCFLVTNNFRSSIKRSSICTYIIFFSFSLDSPRFFEKGIIEFTEENEKETLILEKRRLSEECVKYFFLSKAVLREKYFGLMISNKLECALLDSIILFG
jgi:hypothetical protein